MCHTYQLGPHHRSGSGCVSMWYGVGGEGEGGKRKKYAHFLLFDLENRGRTRKNNSCWSPEKNQDMTYSPMAWST